MQDHRHNSVAWEYTYTCICNCNITIYAPNFERVKGHIIMGLSVLPSVMQWERSGSVFDGTNLAVDQDT